MPRELLRAISRLNAGIASGCRYDVAEDENGTSLCTTTECWLHELTLPVFDALLTELTHRIAALDRVLMENGYGR